MRQMQFYSLSIELRDLQDTMPRKNEILVCSNNKGKRNIVNVKHIVEGKEVLRIGWQVTVKLGNRRYL